MNIYKFNRLVKESHSRSIIAGGRYPGYEWWNDGWWICELSTKIGYLANSITQIGMPQKAQFEYMADIVARIEQWLPKENLADFNKLVNKEHRKRKIIVENEMPEAVWFSYLAAEFGKLAAIMWEANNSGLPRESDTEEYLANIVVVIHKWACFYN